MAPLFVSREILTSDELPPLPASAKYFTVAYSEARELGDGEVYCSWTEERTRVTDSPGLAVAWALMLAGVADDGENPHPLARVTGFSVDPTENSSDDEERLPGEQAVIYVTAGGDVVSSVDREFSDLNRLTAEWPEIVRVVVFDEVSAVT